jgi:uncharacterized protein (TIGR03437 family)
VDCTNANAQGVSFSIISSTEEGSGWLSTNLTNGLLPSGTAPLQVQGSAASLPPGVYQGQVRVGFGDGTSPVINVVLDVSAASGTTAMTESTHAQEYNPRDSNCLAGTYLNPVLILNQNPQSFQLQQASDSLSIYASALDNCNNPITGSTPGITVQLHPKSCATYTACGDLANQSFGMTYQAVDPSLQNLLGQYAWQSTWSPLASDLGKVYLFVVVEYGNAGTVGAGISAPWSGSVTAGTAEGPPEPDGAVNAASASLDGITQLNLVAAGSYVELGGEFLANGTDTNPAFPFPINDQGAQVTLAGQPLQMVYVSPTQVNVLLPATLPMGKQQLTLSRDGVPAMSTLQIPIASAQPAIFTLPPSKSQGAVRIAGTGTIVAPVGSYPGSRPATAGVDYIEIYCNGLGPVSNTPAYGQQASGPPLLSQTPTLPVVTIGGVPATVTFSGLSPHSVSLYQVDVLVPAGVPAGDAVPIMLQMLGLTSNMPTIAVQSQ